MDSTEKVPSDSDTPPYRAEPLPATQSPVAKPLGASLSRTQRGGDRKAVRREGVANKATTTEKVPSDSHTQSSASGKASKSGSHTQSSASGKASKSGSHTQSSASSAGRFSIPHSAGRGPRSGEEGRSSQQGYDYRAQATPRHSHPQVHLCPSPGGEGGTVASRRGLGTKATPSLRDGQDVGEADFVAFAVPKGFDHERADKILASAFPDFSRSRLQKIIDSGAVRRISTLSGGSAAVGPEHSSASGKASKSGSHTQSSASSAGRFSIPHSAGRGPRSGEEGGRQGRPGASLSRNLRGGDRVDCPASSINAGYNHHGVELVEANSFDGRFSIPHSAGREPLAARREASPVGEAVARKTPLSSGDILVIKFPKPTIPALVPTEIPLDVVYEDDDIVVINKEPGIITHPGAGTGDDTLVHALLHHTKGKLAQAGGEARPGVVHRLDKETSGLILFAKTDAAYYSLVDKFRERNLNKEYIAIVDKAPELLAGTVDAPIERHPTNRLKMMVRENGKPALTDWFVEEKFGTSAALVRCVLHTGRTHQIRVHLAFLGHPILGDKLYGSHSSRHEGWPLPRVMLHAAHLSLEHPISGKPLDFTALPPPDFANLATFLRERFGSRLYSQKR